MVDKAVTKRRMPNPKSREEFLALQIKKIWPTSVSKIDPNFAEEFNAIHGLPVSYRFSDKGLIGLEIEVENIKKIDPNIPLCYWDIEEDGSLRNNGREFKTKGAIRVQQAEPALVQLFSGLNADLDFSVRTSIHVHQNVRSMRLDQLLTMIFLYIIMENLLFVFAGSNRRNSIYCVPIFDTALMDLFSDLDVFMRHIQHEGAGYLETVWPKYSALNLMPMSKFGSVEYRQFPGTTNIHKILVWIDLITRLKIWAYKTDFAKARDIINALNTNSSYHALVVDVFGELTKYLDLTSLPALMEKNVHLIKNVTITNEFHKLLYKTHAEAGSMFSSLFKSNRVIWTQLTSSQQKWLVNWAVKNVVAINSYDEFVASVWNARLTIMDGLNNDTDRVTFSRILDRCAELLA